MTEHPLSDHPVSTDAAAEPRAAECARPILRLVGGTAVEAPASGGDRAAAARAAHPSAWAGGAGPGRLRPVSALPAEDSPAAPGVQAGTRAPQRGRAAPGPRLVAPARSGGAGEPTS